MSSVKKSRKFFWIVSALACLSLVVPTVVSLNRWQETIAASLTESLGRTVRIGDVHLTLWGRPGLEITNVIVEEAPTFGIEPFIRMESLRAAPDLESLWRGQIRFSSLVFERPSLNVVRNEAGEWNVGTLWNGAGNNVSADSRTTVLGRMSFHSLPTIRVESGRINFKVRNQKMAYVLDEVDLTLVQPHSQDEPWRLQFEGTPNRTDFSLYPVSRIGGQAEFAPSLSSLREETGIPMHLDLTAENAFLGDLLKLILGNDYGVHGTTRLEYHLAGTTSLLRFSGTAELQDLHRWDLLPSRAGSHLAAEMEGILDLSGESLQVTAASLRLGNGSITVQGRVEELLHRPQPDFQLQLQGISLTSVLEIVKHFTTRLDIGFLIEGTLQGDIEMTGIPPNLTGTLNVTQGYVEEQGTSRVIRVSNFPVIFDGKGGVLGPWKAEFGKGDELTGSLSWDVEKRAYSMQFQGEELSLVELLQWMGALGNHRGGTEVTEGNLSLKVEISATADHPPQVRGWAEVSEAVVRSAVVNQPIQVHSARLEFQDNQVHARSFSANLGDTDLQGSLTVNIPASQIASFSHDAPLWTIEFDCQSPWVDLETLNQLLNPSYRQDRAWFFFRWKSDETGNSPLFSTIIARGQLEADRVSYRGVELENFRSMMTLQKRILEITEFSASFAGGHHTGHATIQFSPGTPSFIVGTRFTNLDLGQITQIPIYSNRPLSGNVSGVLRLASSGGNWKEILERLGGSGEIKGRHLILRGLDLAEAPNFDPDADTPLASLTAAFQISKQEFLLNPLEITLAEQSPRQSEQASERRRWVLSGTIGFDGQMNLLVKPSGGSHQYRWAGTLAEPTITETLSQLMP